MRLDSTCGRFNTSKPKGGVPTYGFFVEAKAIKNLGEVKQWLPV